MLHSLGWICEVPIPKQLIVEDDSDSEDDYYIENELHESEGGSNNIDEILYEDIDQKKAFIVVTDSSGQRQLLKKSTLVWLLTEENERVSSDRLIRVQNHPKPKPTQNYLTGNYLASNNKIHVSENIKVDDWCAFKYARGRIAKDKIYKNHCVNLIDTHLAKELDVLSTWYLLNDRGNLVPVRPGVHTSNIKYTQLFHPHFVTEKTTTLLLLF